MYERFSNEDNDKPAADAQAAFRLFLEAVDGPPPTSSRHGKDSLFGSKEEDLVNALAKSYLTQEKKTGEFPERTFKPFMIAGALAAGSFSASVLKRNTVAEDYGLKTSETVKEDRNAMDKPTPEDAPRDGKEAAPAAVNERRAYDIVKEPVTKPGLLNRSKEGHIPVPPLRSLIER